MGKLRPRSPARVRSGLRNAMLNTARKIVGTCTVQSSPRERLLQSRCQLIGAHRTSGWTRMHHDGCQPTRPPRAPTLEARPARDCMVRCGRSGGLEAPRSRRSQYSLHELTPPGAAITKLVSDATQHGARGGHLHVCVARVHQPRMEWCVCRSGPQRIVEIMNTCPAVPALHRCRCAPGCDQICRHLCANPPPETRGCC